MPTHDIQRTLTGPDYPPNGMNQRLPCLRPQMRTVVIAVLISLPLAACGTAAFSRSRQVRVPVGAVYPPIAIGTAVSGDVDVTVAVAADGRVSNAQAVSGPILLRAPAEFAALDWKFKSSSKATVETIRFRFRLVATSPGAPAIQKQRFTRPRTSEVVAITPRDPVLP